MEKMFVIENFLWKFSITNIFYNKYITVEIFSNIHK